MRVSTLASLAFLPAVAVAQNATASAAYLQAVLGALTAANLTGLVGAASAIANTTAGQALLGQLSVGNKTVFAPSNEAFANVSQSILADTDLVTQILSYHILNTTYTAAGISTTPSHNIARTLLNGNGFSLPGNKSAPLVLTDATANASSFNIVQATDNFTAQGPAIAANLYVYIIPEVLTLPPNITSIAGTLFPSLAGVIQSAGLLDPLAASPGLTIFAPNNAAIANISSALGSLNTSAISTILANHVINGSVVYSTGLTSSNYTSAAGEPFTFISNSSGTYVSSAASTAKIVQSDIIINNGVVHLIDGVLLNSLSNTTAAAAAYSSGIAAAATATEATGAVTATSAASTATASGATISKAAAGRIEPFGLTNGVLGSAFAFLGVVAGGGYLLL